MGSIVIVPPYVDNTSADLYFASRYPSNTWAAASSGDKTATLTTASDAIDRLNFAGVLASIILQLTVNGTLSIGTTVIPVSGVGIVPDGSVFYLDGYTYPVVSHVETGSNTTSITTSAPGLIVAANPGDPIKVYQARQFPRGTDKVVPQEILKATCELAFALLDGADPSIEAENVNTTGQSEGDVRTTYERSFAQPHILAGIPSIQAWHLLLPFLRDPSEVRVVRDSYRLGLPQSFI